MNTTDTDSTKPRKRHAAILRITAIIAGIALSLCIAEVGLRIAGFSYHLYPEQIEFGMPDPVVLKKAFVDDPDLFWVPPGYQQKRLAPARKSHPQIVFMGCSCTQWGRYDDAFARLVVDRKHASQPRLVNLGVAGWSTHQGLRQLRRDILPLQPKVVTVFFGWNDHWKGFGVRDEDVTMLRNAWWYQLSKYSRLVQLCVKALVAQEAPSEGPMLRVPPQEFRDNLIEIVRLCKANNIIPVLLTAPTSITKGHEPSHLRERHIDDLSNLVPLHQQYVTIVREVAHSQGAVLCDLEQEFRKLPTDKVRSQYFIKDGIHLTRNGNEKIGEFLFRCLDQNGVLDRLGE